MCSRCDDGSKRGLLKRALRKYDLLIEDYHDLLSQQKGLCALCGNNDNNGGTTLCIDHNHKTGKVRGLLCHSCNLRIAGIDNSKDLMNCLSYSFQNYSPSKKKLITHNELLKKENALLIDENKQLKKLYKLHGRKMVHPKYLARYLAAVTPN